MTEPVHEEDPKQPNAPAGTGLRSHLREIVGSTRSLSTMFLVLLVLAIIAGGCALLLR